MIGRLDRLGPILVATLLVPVGRGAAAQVIEGRVTGPGEALVSDVLVKLVDGEGTQRDLHLRHAWEQGWNLVDILRRGEAAGVVARETPRGVCIEFRRGCLPFYLNGMRVPNTMVRELPIEMLEVAVIVQPGESVEYEDGGVLLFTVHWMACAR